MEKDCGSKNYFDLNWEKRVEKHPYFTNKTPQSQLQLAFKNHFELFDKLILNGKKGKCLEAGCGRGNMSLYFAANGYECSLLDISANVIDIAKENFSNLNLKGTFYQGDAQSLPFEENTFDVVFSIGLLEHFSDPEKVISEQLRILKKGGVFIGYVVPERFFNVQTFFIPLNFFLSFLKKLIIKKVDTKNNKNELYRSNYGSDYYLKIMSELNFKSYGSFGIFPIPLISYSAIYPFTPLPKSLEKAVTCANRGYLAFRSIFLKNPWKCSELWGQAFVVYGEK